MDGEGRRALTRRLDRLERENRRLRHGGLGVALSLAGLLLMGQSFATGRP